MSLLGFAFGLIRNAARKDINRVEAGVAVAMDLGWVLGSVVLIAIGLLSNSGNVLLFAVGDVVLLFAILPSASRGPSNARRAAVQSSRTRRARLG